MKFQINKKGFTLVEVMIVVAIIGLLAAIAIPNLLRARINANDGAVKGDLRAFSTAAESYRAAQTTPAYPVDIPALTSGTNPYLDSSWSASGTKHGHTITFLQDSANNSYSLQGASQSGASATTFCVDHTGVLRSGATAAATGCSGGTVVS